MEMGHWIPVLSPWRLLSTGFFPARPRSVGHQLRKADRRSVWAPACQDQLAGGHAGTGVISPGGAPLSAPPLITTEFQEFFRLGRAMRVVLPTGDGGVVHLFVIYGYQGSEEDSEKLLLADKVLRAVLAEAQAVCVGQPQLVVGDSNADPGVLPCLAKGVSSGRFVDLALAHSVGAGMEPDMTCKFKLDERAGSRRDFVVACPCGLAATTACWVTDWWFAPNFSLFAEFNIRQWTAEVSCPRAAEPVWPACWIPDSSASSSSKVVQEIWDSLNEELGVVPPGLILALRAAFEANSVDDFWGAWSSGTEAGLIAERVAWSLVVCKLFLVAAPMRSGGAVLEVGLFVVVLPVSCILSVRGMRLTQPLSSSSSTPHLLLHCFFAVGFGIRQRGFSEGRWDACAVGGIRSVSRALAAPSPPLNPGHFGSLLIFVVSVRAYLMHWACLATSLSRWWWLVVILGRGVGYLVKGRFSGSAIRLSQA